MNFHLFKITEKQNNFYVYYLSLFDDPELTMETFEHFVANSPNNQMCQYLMACDFDEMTAEKVIGISANDAINDRFPSDPKCMNNSNDFVPLIPPAKPKRTAKPKGEKTPKPKGKKTTSNVTIQGGPIAVNTEN